MPDPTCICDGRNICMYCMYRNKMRLLAVVQETVALLESQGWTGEGAGRENALLRDAREAIEKAEWRTAPAPEKAAS